MAVIIFFFPSSYKRSVAFDMNHQDKTFGKRARAYSSIC